MKIAAYFLLEREAPTATDVAACGIYGLRLRLGGEAKATTAQKQQHMLSFTKKRSGLGHNGALQTKTQLPKKAQK